MAKEISDFVVFKNAKLEQKYSGKKIPMAILIEEYFDGNLDISGSMEELLAARNEFVKYSFTPDHIKFFVTRFIPEVVIHSKKQDERIVRDHYDRGNDFFNWFLGETMCYTTGFFKTGKEDLETAQEQKMDLVCRKMQLQEGENHLDIGCGWGTLARYAAMHFGSKSTGITIAEKQTEYANGKIAEDGLEGKAEVRCLDYRDIPNQKYDKISCLEMAEHVGVKNFQKFINQVRDLLTDDGVFYLQIAGLRSGFHFEDLVWGLFMSKYIFPGADASMPLAFVVKALEKAGLEVHSVENVGIHYSVTIHRWYDNWMKNRDEVVATYGERWFRIWEVFLGWSVIIARQGSSTCFQIVANKNLDTFDRTRWFGEKALGESDSEVSKAPSLGLVGNKNNTKPRAEA